jgi:hypothetical protein
MIELILYLVEVNVLLALCYLTYVVVLSKETFFQFNRFFLLALPVLALSFPLLRLDIKSPAVVVEQRIVEMNKLRKSYYDAIAAWEFESRTKKSGVRPVDTTGFSISSYGWFTLLSTLFTAVYTAGVVLCLSRTVWTIRWINRLLSRHSPEERAGVKVIKLAYPTAPFSFLNYVFIHAPVADTSDFDQILAHERTHIKEKHSIDLIFVQFVASLLWFNPIIWRLAKSLKTIHEYIADEKIIKSGYSAVEYQTLLLRQLISNNSLELVHNFNLSFIKKRIAMMNHKKSGWAGKIKVAFTIAVTILMSTFIIQCNSKLDDHVNPLSETTKSSVDVVELPTLPVTSVKFDGDVSNAVVFTIVNNTLMVDGRQTQIEQIELLKGDEVGRAVPILMMVDKNQTMGFVRKVQMALRKADRRKLLYLGKTTTNDRVEVALVLPPDPEKVPLPNINAVADEFLLKIELGNNDGILNQQQVYNFVTTHYAKGTANESVVSARINDRDNYNSYLANVFYIKEGYNQIYQERARKMFGKDFHKTTQEEYQAVRENLPMNISIAED